MLACVHPPPRRSFPVEEKRYRGIGVQGYSFIHNPRVDRDGGGVGLYLAEHLKFKNRTDLTFVNDCAESLFVEVIRPTEKKKSHPCYI